MQVSLNGRKYVSLLGPIAGIAGLLSSSWTTFRCYVLGLLLFLYCFAFSIVYILMLKTGDRTARAHPHR